MEIYQGGFEAKFVPIWPPAFRAQTNLVTTCTSRYVIQSPRLGAETTARISHSIFDLRIH